MSPTSYQAAPPRDYSSYRKSIVWSTRALLPTAIRRAVKRRHLVRSRVHISDPRPGLVRAELNVIKDDLPVFLARDRIVGHRANILRADQVIQRSRRLLLVVSKLVNGLAHHKQVLSQGPFPAAHHRTLVAPSGHAQQDHDDRDHDHQFEHRESC